MQSPAPSNRPAAARPVVAMAGTFDISNFGDALFPVLARWRLAELADEVIALSPTAGLPIWRDSLPVRVLEDFHRSDEPCDLVLLGGGDIVHLRATPPGFYDDGGYSRWSAYASLWGGAALLAHSRGCPLAWNAPGVPEPLGAELGEFLVGEGSPAAYVSVRDHSSLDNLPASARSAVQVVPDTLVETASMWPRGERLASDCRRVFHELTGSPPPERFVTVHVNGFATPTDSTEAMAAAIEHWCRLWKASAVFVCPGLVHQDPRWVEPVMGALIARGTGAAKLVVETSMRDLVAVLAHSCGYLGSSMHGFVVSSSYGVPAMAVMPRDNPAQIKLSGHMELCSWRGQRLWASWQDLAEGLRAAPAADLDLELMVRESSGYLARFQTDLDRHWERVAGCVGSLGPAGTPPVGSSWLRSWPMWSPLGRQVATRLTQEFCGDLREQAARTGVLQEKLQSERDKTKKLRAKLIESRAERQRLRSSWAWRIARWLWSLEKRVRR